MLARTVAVRYTLIMTILAVAFDYGSVLAWPPASEGCDRVAAAAGVPRSVLLERYYRHRPAYDHGTLDDIEYWRHLTGGYPAERDDALLATLAALDAELWSQANETVLGWLPELKRRGVRLAVLSNMPASFAHALEERDRWLELFDHRIYSGLVQLSKPDPAIYRLLLERMNDGPDSIGPGNVLFLDDLEANVRGARAVGINAELYNVFDGGLPRIAQEYGLPVPTEV